MIGVIVAGKLLLLRGAAGIELGMLVRVRGVHKLAMLKLVLLVAVGIRVGILRIWLVMWWGMRTSLQRRQLLLEWELLCLLLELLKLVLLLLLLLVMVLLALAAVWLARRHAVGRPSDVPYFSEETSGEGEERHGGMMECGFLDFAGQMWKGRAVAAHEPTQLPACGEAGEGAVAHEPPTTVANVGQTLNGFRSLLGVLGRSGSLRFSSIGDRA